LETVEVKICSIGELEKAGRILFTYKGNAIALFYRGGRVYAVDNRCPHMGFPLIKGSVSDGILTCDWHHARFDLESGCSLDVWAGDAWSTGPGSLAVRSSSRSLKALPKILL